LPDVEAGVWANDVEAFGDVEDVTLDFIRIGPRDPRTGVSSPRFTLSRPCIIKLKHELEINDEVRRKPQGEGPETTRRAGGTRSPAQSGRWKTRRQLREYDAG
jgi:hypothetical protein